MAVGGGQPGSSSAPCSDFDGVREREVLEMEAKLMVVLMGSEEWRYGRSRR